MKTVFILKSILLVIGLLMLLEAAVYCKMSSDFLAESISAQGKVVKLLPESDGRVSYYIPVVEFKERNGWEVRFKYLRGSSDLDLLGKAVEVLYLPSDPERAELKDFYSPWGRSVMPGLIGTVMIIIYVLIHLVGVLNRRKRKYLLQNGLAVKAKFNSVVLNEGVYVDGITPFVIVCEWFDLATSEKHIFESEDIYFDPTDYIKSKTIMVFIEPGNPGKYYVDISFLPPEVNA